MVDVLVSTGTLDKAGEGKVAVLDRAWVEQAPTQTMHAAKRAPTAEERLVIIAKYDA